MPLDIPRRSNSSLRGRPPHDAAKADSEAFNDAVQQVKSTGSVGAAARKLALYAKMTGVAPPASNAGTGEGAGSGAGAGKGGVGKEEGKEGGIRVEGEGGVREGDADVAADGDGDVQMGSPGSGEGNAKAASVKPEPNSKSTLGQSGHGSSAPPKPPIQTRNKPSAFDDPEEQEYNARNAYIAAQAKRNNAARGGAAHTSTGTAASGKAGNGYIAEDDEYAIEDEDMEDDTEVRQGRRDSGEEDEEEEDEEEEPVVHLQEIVEGLWVGDLVAAMDTEGLKERGISNILSLLRPKIQCSADFAVFPLEIDDSPDTDILTHLPTCVAWVGEALRRRERARERLRRSSSQSIRRRTSTSSQKSSSASRSPTSPLAEGGGHVRENSPPEERDVLIRHLPQTTAGAVLVHCQAGMSRSATAAAAYLMTALGLAPDEAVDMIRSKRPVVDPSETFWHQLGLFHSADGRVSLRDRGTRQFYMERTTTRFMNRGGQPDISHMAKYPATPTASSPPTPSGSHGKRKIRCKMCRRHLAVREHMMDHILDQSPASRPRTPSIGAMSAAAMTPILPQDAFTSAGQRERRASVVSDIINPLTGLPGARSRHASMSSDRPVLGDLSIPNSAASQPASTVSSAAPTASSQGSVPTPRSRSIDVTASGFGMTAMTAPHATRSQSSQGFTPGRKGSVGSDAADAGAEGGMMVDTPPNMSRSSSMDHRSHSTSSHGVRRKSSLSQMSNADGTSTRQFRSADQIYAHLPPQLAALRMAQSGGQPSAALDTAASTPDAGSPPSSPERESHSSATMPGGKPFPPMPHQGQAQAQYPPNHPLAHLQNSQSAHAPHVPHGHGHVQMHKNEGARGAARRMSMLALTPTEGTSPGADRTGLHGHASNGNGSGTNSPRERRGSGVFGFGGEIATGGPPILVNPKCSGYFVEPLTWMEPVLSSGQISGKLVCPNEKCGAKIGNYDWAGVQCGCREWVTPGFCISRSKVDEVW